MFFVAFFAFLLLKSSSTLASEDQNAASHEIQTVVKNLRPKLVAVLHKEGFHKLLQFKLDFEHILPGCDLTMKQDFPPAVYVDTDEIYGLVTRQGHNITFPDFVDIEKSTESSQGFAILLHSELKKFRTTIPVHYRYHSPGAEQFVNVKLDVPKIYINCPEWADTAHKGECFDEAKTLTRKCGWIQAPVVVLEKIQLTANIPRGDASIGALVKIVTIGISWIGCIVVVYSILVKMKKDVKKNK